LKTLIKDNNVYNEIIESKRFAWLFKSEPCPLCKSIYNSLIDILDDPLKVYDMLYAKKLILIDNWVKAFLFGIRLII